MKNRSALNFVIRSSLVIIPGNKTTKKILRVLRLKKNHVSCVTNKYSGQPRLRVNSIYLHQVLEEINQDVLFKCTYPLPRFSQTSKLLSPKAASIIGFFAAINHNDNHKQWTLKHRNTQNGSKSTNHRSQTMTFWTCFSKVLFPKRSAKMIPCQQRPFNLSTVDKSCLGRLKGLCSSGTKMIGGSKKCKHHLAFELQSSRVFEKHSKLKYKGQQKGATCFATLLQNELKDPMLHIQPPMNQTCLVTNLIVASCVNYDFWWDKIICQSHYTWDWQVYW